MQNQGRKPKQKLNCLKGEIILTKGNITPHLCESQVEQSTGIESIAVKVAKVINDFNASRKFTSILEHEVEIDNQKNIIITRINRLSRNGVRVNKVSLLENNTFVRNMILDLTSMMKGLLPYPVKICLSSDIIHEQPFER